GAYSVAVVPINKTDHVFVGTAVGVYEGFRSGAFGWEWSRVGAAMPNVKVTDLQVRNYVSGGKAVVDLVAATYGRDAWVMRLTEDGKLVANVSGKAWDDTSVAVNDVQDDGEAGVAGVFVDLLDADGQVVASTVTDENGQYAFP